MYDFVEDDRVQYDGKDEARLAVITERLTNDAVTLIHALAEYRDELNREVDEDSKARMQEARQNLVEAFAYTQESLVGVGFVVRIDKAGLEERIDSAETRDDLDTSGL